MKFILSFPISSFIVIGLMWFLLIGYTPGTAAFNQTVGMEHFTRNDGLSHRHIIDIFRGNSGRLWVSTQQGLNHYDGYEFREVLYRSPDGEKRQFFRSRFVVDAGENLWAIPSFGDHHGPVLIEYADGTFPKVFEPGGDYHLPEFSRPAILNYVGFEHSFQGREAGKQLKKHLKSDERAHSATLLAEIIHKLVDADWDLADYRYDLITALPNHNYVIWVDKCCFLHLRPEMGKHNIIPFPPRDELPDNWNRDLPFDAKGNFIFPSGLSGNDLIFDTLQIPNQFPEITEELKISKDLVLHFISRHGTLLEMNPFTSEKQIHNFQTDFITSLLPDEDNLLWMGTENGLYRVRFQGTDFENIGSSPIQADNTAPIAASIRSIYKTTSGEVYTNSDHGPLFRVNRENSELIPVFETHTQTGEPLELLLFRVIEESPHGNLVLGSSNGLFFFDTEEEKPHFVETGISGTHVESIFLREEENEVVFGLGDKLVVLNSRTLEVIKATELHPDIVNLVAMDYPYIYANGRNSLLKYDIRSGEVGEVFGLKNPRDITERDIRSLLVTDSVLWLGTFEGFYGLERETYQVLHHWDLAAGLPGEIIFEFQDEGSGFWLGTDNGLTYLDPEKREIRSFFQWDGLSHNEFNTRAKFTDERGHIWMGGLNGINIFDPVHLRNLSPPGKPLFLEYYTYFDQRKEQTHSIPTGGKMPETDIRLGARQNSIQFRMGHYSVSKSGGTKFSWYLEGKEEPWTHHSFSPHISYSNLKPGDYNLKVTAVNYRGVPSKNDLSIPFRINQYWYLQAWAIGLWVLVLSAFAYWLLSLFFNRRLEAQRVSQLRELDHQKTKFYTNITHEFRTPLTVILGQADSLKEEGDVKKPAIPKLESIERSGLQLLSQINRMMDLAKAESGMVKVKPEPLFLLSFLENMVVSFQQFAQSNEVTIEFDPDPSLEDYYLIDAQLLSEIVSNLISNAVKYNRKNGTVHFRAELRSGATDSHRELLIEIADTGPGIQDEHRERIFDRFYRIESTNSNHISGSGVGLALTKQLMVLLGGEIDFNSEMGTGTVFFVKLPVKKAPEKSAVQGYEPVVEGVPPSDSILDSDSDSAMGDKTEITGGIEVLLVEDHREVRDYIKSCLPQSYKVMLAEDGLEGFEMAVESVPDLIISDVMMPRMNGYELCSKLKKHRLTNHIPVLLLTAKTGEESRLTGLREGADAYLVKPFNREELRLKLENLYAHTQKIREKYGGSIAGRESGEPEDLFLRELKQAIEQNYKDEAFAVNELSSVLNLSRSQLFRKTKALTGKTPSRVLKKFRLDKAAEIISENPNLTVAELAYQVGYSSPYHFSNLFFSEFGARPGSYRANS